MTYHFISKANRDKYAKELKANGTTVRLRRGPAALTLNYIQDAIVEPDGRFHPDVDRCLGNNWGTAFYHICTQDW
jgi:hypothetical protein